MRTTQPLTLVSHHLCPYVQRVAIVLNEKDIEHRRIDIDLAAKPDWFRSLSPLGKVPLLQVADDLVLFESAPICEYLEETTGRSLHPENPVARARHRAWMEFGSALLNDIGGFYNAADAAAFHAKSRVIADKFRWIEGELTEGPFFHGQRFSLVDAVFGPIFRYFEVFERYGDFGFFIDTPKTTRWRQTLAARPSVAGAVSADYGERLAVFLRGRNSYLSSLIATQHQQTGIS